MTWRFFFELLVAFFALIGFFQGIRWLAERLFGSRNICIAIEILTQRDAETAEVLIRDALFRCLALPSGKVVVWTVPELWDHPELRAAVRKYGVACYELPTKKK